MSAGKKGWCGPPGSQYVPKGWNGPIENQRLGRAAAVGHSKTHGMSATSEYKIWLGMFRRCYNTKDSNYPNYGGRGIRVCERWSSFSNFWADMDKRQAGKTLDRINNDGNYEPGNCRWATREQQANNMQTNHRITWNGETLTVAQWERRRGMKQHTLLQRLKAGWSVKQAFLTPVLNGRRPDPWNTIPVRKGHSHIIDGKNLSAWARETGMPLTTIQGRLARGWPAERALTEPQRMMKRKSPVAVSLPESRLRTA
jgi:hypothetical protein